MATIRDLFDPTRALTRPIEKVITYANRSNEQLTTEVSEYIVTERIEHELRPVRRHVEGQPAAFRGRKGVGARRF